MEQTCQRPRVGFLIAVIEEADVISVSPNSGACRNYPTTQLPNYPTTQLPNYPTTQLPLLSAGQFFLSF